MAVITLTINGENKASGALRDVREGINDIDGAADKAAGSTKSFLGGFTGALAGGAIVGGIAAIGSSLTGAFSAGLGDAREAAIIMAQTEAVITSTGNAAGVTADQVADLATNLSAASGASLFGDAQIQESSNLLLTFTNIKGAALEAATAMSVDMAQALGGAPKDSAIQLGKALNDPIAGITALSRVGVSFTEQQKEQITAMTEAGDVAGAQGLILAELNKEFGGSAAAAAAADGGVAQFSDRLGEAAETISGAFLPLITQAMTFLGSPEVMGVLENLATSIATGLTAAITGVGTAFTFLQENWGTIQPILVGLGAAIMVGIVPAFIAWAAGAASAATATIVALAPVLVPLAAIGAAVAALKYAWDNNFFGIRDTVTTFWNNTLRPFIDQVITWFQTTLPPIITALQTTFTTAWNAIQLALGILGGIFSTTWAAIQLSMSTVSTYVTGTLLPALTGAWTSVNTGLTTLGGYFSTAFGYIKDTVIAPILAATTLIVDAFLNGGTTGVLKLFWNALESLQRSAEVQLNWLKSMVFDSILGNIKNITQGYVNDIKGFFLNGWDAAKNSVKGVFDTISGYISGPINSAKGAVETAIGIIKGLVSSGISQVNSLIDAVNSIPGVPDIPHVPGNALGVRNFSGGLTWVGERGPELISLPRGANVYTNGESQRMAPAHSSVQDNRQYHTHVTTQPTVYKTEKRLVDEIRYAEMAYGVF